MSHDDDRAWLVAHAFGRGLTSRLGDELCCAVVIGSLADGTFLPGISGVDTALILGHDADDRIRTAIAAATRDARAVLVDPPQIHCIPLTEPDLVPPYDPEKGTAFDVLRVHDHGLLIAGTDPRPAIVRPTPGDFAAAIRHLDADVRKRFERMTPDTQPTYRELYSFAATACRHHIFMKENLLIWRKTEVLLAFLVGYEDHSRAAAVRRLIELGPGHDEVSAALVTEIAALWRELHEEVVS